MRINRLRRREFITLLGGAAAWPRAARAQEALAGFCLAVELTRPKTDDQLKSDARALAVRFARAFADTIEN